MRFARPIDHDCLPSTNDHLKELIRSGEARDGLVVTAGRQTAGRGRLGRRWSSPRGNLHLSLARRIVEPLEICAAATLVAGTALARALEQLSDLRPGIKWPNDLLIGDRKLAGILTEGLDRWQVIGLGVNLRCRREDLEPELGPTAAILTEEAPRCPAPSELADTFLSILGPMLDAFVQQEALDLDSFYHYWSDRGRVTISGPGASVSGRAIAVTSTGALVLDTTEGPRTIQSGEITTR